MNNIEFKPVSDELLAKGHHLEGDEAISEGQRLPNTVAPIGAFSMKGTDAERDSRWAMTPLYTTYHEHAYAGEYLCDPGTGEPAIKREDGTFISISEIGRTNYHLEIFTTALSYLGMRKAIINSAIPEDDSKVTEYNRNALDDTLVLTSDTVINKMVISLDVSVLVPVKDSSMLRLIDKDPLIKVDYTLGNGTVTRTIEHKASELRYIPIPVNDTKVTFKGISLPDVDINGYTCFIHTIFIAHE